MKRIALIILTMLLLAACVPTPEQEFVVNKGDSIAEQKINETSGAEAGAQTGVGRQTFPDRWDEEPIAESAHLIVRAHAGIRTKADGLYPVYRTREAEITAKTVENIAVKFLDKPTSSSESLMTKDDYGRALQHFLDERARYEEWVKAGKPDDWSNVDECEWSPEEIERETNWYMERIKNAPDSLTSQAVNDYSGLIPNKIMTFTLASGETASISFNEQYMIIGKGCSGIPNLYSVYNYQEDLEWKEGKYAKWMNPEVSYEDAQAVCLSEAERLGFTGFTIAGSYEATLFNSVGVEWTAVTGGWCFDLTRGFDGYPQFASYVYASQNLDYGSGDDYTVNKVIRNERLTMFVSRDGLQMIRYDGPKDVSGLVNANVELLPFDEIKVRIANALLSCFPYERAAASTEGRDENSPRLELEIYEITLSTFTLHIKDSTDFYEMPCWLVSYDCCDPVRGEADWEYRKSMREFELNDPNLQHDVLVINAVDGSIVHPDYGY
ncbi:MAG: hypothetical protein IKI52_00115 [Clostridia bacterium]|nr:hypothetical protein [Clostridia bacterium]